MYFLQIAALGVILARLVAAGDDDWESPVYKNLYSVSLPIPPVKAPLRSITSSNGIVMDYYEVEIKPFETQVYPGLGKTKLVGYDGISPGPTFVMEKGRAAVVRFVNNATRANSVHLHGSYSRAPFDGWAEDLTEPGQYKDYYYPNAQNARTMWYHDHAIDHTAENAYFGQAGFYLLHDDEERQAALPQGKYDVPLALAAKRYNKDGTLWSPEANGETESVYGDVIHVNGQPWPYLNVEPRRYRFRFLNTAISRTFNLWFETATKKKLPFVVVASDAGLLTGPVSTPDLAISMAERWEVVFDFSTYAGQNVTIRNDRDVGADEDYNSSDKVMRFVVGKAGSVTDQSNNAEPKFTRAVPYPPNKNTVDKELLFSKSGGRWSINDVGWSDGETARVLRKPQRGAVERWTLKNGGGGWSHPIHIHLVDFQIVKRTDGKRGVLPYEKAALKDVVWLNTGESVDVIARFAPWDGLYMFHCHNLIHEDHEMMAALNVTALADLDYDEKTRFLDPMDPQYRAKTFSKDDYLQRSGDFGASNIDAKLEFFASLEAYRGDEAEAKLEQYWSTKTLAVTSSASSKTSSVASTLTTKTSVGASAAVTSFTTTTSLKSSTSAKASTSKTTTTKK